MPLTPGVKGKRKHFLLPFGEGSMVTKMTTLSTFFAALVLGLLCSTSSASASSSSDLVLHGQAPFPLNKPIAASSADRIFLSAQTSNGVSVVDPFDAKLLGVVPLGGRLPETLGALYRGQSIVHGSGFSPDRRTVAAVCVGSDSVAFLDATGEKDYGVLNITSVGRSPHEASWSPSGDEVWVAIRGENFVEVLNGRPPFEAVSKVKVPEGPGMVAFSPDGNLAFVCSSFTPETVVVDAATKEIVATIKQNSTFCPNLAVTPDGEQLWLTLKDSGRTQVVEAKAPFRTIAVLETGSVTNHVNFAVPPTAATAAKGGDDETNSNKNATTLAFVSVGGERKVHVFDTKDVAFGSPPPKLLKTIDLPEGGDEPHAVWPSGDGTRMWVGLQISNAVVALDTAKLEVVDGSRVEIGAQSPMGMVYVPGAASAASGSSSSSSKKAKAAAAAGETKGALISPEKAKEQSRAFHFELVSSSSSSPKKGKNGGDDQSKTDKSVLTSLVVNQQGTFVDALEAVVAGLTPGESYALCLTKDEGGNGGSKKGKDGDNKIEDKSSSSCDTVVAEFKGGKDGAANVATVGPFTDLLFEKKKETSAKNVDGRKEQLKQQKRFFVVVPRQKEGGELGGAVQVQQSSSKARE